MFDIEGLKKIINAIYIDKPILAELCLRQAILESRLQGKPSRLALEGYNLFGIKGKGDLGSIEFATQEYINNKWITVQAKFAKFSSYRESVKWHRQLMQRLRYESVWTSKTLAEACHEIWKDGYATSPTYPQDLLMVKL